MHAVNIERATQPSSAGATFMVQYALAATAHSLCLCGPADAVGGSLHGFRGIGHAAKCAAAPVTDDDAT